jgi:hypothetical protein
MSGGFMLKWSWILAGTLWAQQPDTALQSLVQSERSFATLSVAEGMRDAFLGNLAPDGIIFRPGPVNGIESWASRKAVPVLLTWEPETADIASSGDLGFTTGPWEARDYGPRKNPPAHGYYTSVWKRQPDGQWKVLLDIGTFNPEPDTQAVTFAAMPSYGEPPPSGDTATARKNLESAEKKLSEAIRQTTFREGAKPHFHAGARIHRTGHFPVKGISTNGSEGFWNQSIAYDSPQLIISRAVDFACVFGTYRTGDEHGSYVRLWKRSGHSWKVILDLMSPYPPQ